MRKLSAKPLSKPRRIGVVIYTQTSFIERDVLKGIVRYSAEVRNWQIVGAGDVAVASRIFRRWPPAACINVGWRRGDFGPLRWIVAALWPMPGHPAVLIDEQAVGRLAAQHFLARGFRHFAYVGPRDMIWSSERETGYRAELASVLEAGATYESRDVASPTVRWDLPSPELQDWVGKLPKPVAVFACNDHCGREIVDAALMTHVRVPDEVAVLGVDNDELECEMTAAPLSSIVYPCEELGYRAAQLLDGLLDGEAAPTAPLLVAPTAIRNRRSTDVLAVSDHAVAAACRFVREHAGAAIGVDTVARAAHLSKRSLQMRYRLALNRSVHDDIIQSRLDLARDLLVRTRLPLKDIASRAGFGTAAHLAKVFRKKLQTTPGALRRAAPPVH